MNELKVGVVGATGLVGSYLLRLLHERSFPIGSLRLFASSRSAGKVLQFGRSDVVVEDVASADFSGLNVVFMSAGSSVSLQIAEAIAAAGAIVIDNSSAWRKNDDVPLVVADVNDDHLSDIPKGIVANPNCTTMVAMPVVKPLHDRFGLVRMVASSYQAVSGTGKAGVDALASQLILASDMSGELVSGECKLRKAELGPYPLPIGANVLSIAGNLVDDETDEEKKLRDESRRILSIDSLDVTATCVRVPVFSGHSVSLDLEFEHELQVEDATQLLSQSPGVSLVDIPTPLEAAGGDATLVGRIRRSGVARNRLALFLCGDNLRKGAALNAIQIAERLGDYR